jgi:hypothetical protein
VTSSPVDDPAEPTRVAVGAPLKEATWAVAEHRMSAELLLTAAAGLAVSFNASALEEHITDTGNVRAQIEPPVASDLVLGQVVAAVGSPVWKLEQEAHSGNVILHLRDPRFGWLHYVLGRDSSRSLAAQLLRYAETVPEAPREA